MSKRKDVGRMTDEIVVVVEIGGTWTALKAQI